MGLTKPLMANVDVIFVKRIYEKLNPSPMPIFIPIPPLILREESDTPIRVRIKKEAIFANRV